MRDNVVQEFISAVKSEPEKKEQIFSATVSRIDEEGTVWVFVAGSNKETPTSSTSASVKSGDEVNVMWQNNKLYIVGNYSDPSSGIAKMRQVEMAANTAREAANNAVTDAGRARQAAEEAEATANSVRGIAVEAQTDAGIAKSAADKAVKDLSQVENVVGVVNWIAEHGEMISQAGGTFDPAKVYFIVDPNGDYHIGNTHYSVVAEPKAEDIDDYYILNINESVQNYVTTHLYADSEGLWLIPEENATPQSSSKKILIAVGGQGHTYSTAGTYIIEKVNNVDRILAAFISSGVNVYNNGELCAHFGDDVTIGKEHVPDHFVTTINDNGFGIDRWHERTSFVHLFSVVYNARTDREYICIGDRPSDADYGRLSVSMGDFSDPSIGPLGYASVAMNRDTTASGQASLAQGERSIAGGWASVAMNNHTVANYKDQTVIGRYNDNKANNAFEIGNGQYDYSLQLWLRSNAFTVDWDGNVNASGDVEDGSGNVLSEKIGSAQIARGTKPLGKIAANSYVDVPVTFDTPFSSTPTVVVSLQSTSTSPTMGSIGISPINITKNGFTARVFNNTNAQRTPAMTWIATDA